jgi:hypothetical protein
VIDTLAEAKQMFPGKRNSLDALCDRFGISNAHRTLHGALLDSELLAEVYLAMTRGQNSLVIDMLDDPGADGGTANGQRISLASLDLPVVAASDDELAAHRRSSTSWTSRSRAPASGARPPKWTPSKRPDASDRSAALHPRLRARLQRDHRHPAERERRAGRVPAGQRDAVDDPQPQQRHADIHAAIRRVGARPPRSDAASAATRTARATALRAPAATRAARLSARATAGSSPISATAVTANNAAILISSVIRFLLE